MKSARVYEGTRRGRIELYCLLTALYYLWYRYPFQINSSQTSPTYSDTPPLIEIGKYVLLAIIGIWALIQLLVMNASSHNWKKFHSIYALVDTAMVLLGVTVTLKAILVRDSQLFEFGVVTILATPMVMATVRIRVNLKGIATILASFLIISLLVEGLEVFLYYHAGRLPALAYTDSVSVRFGALWDDPNGWGIFCSFLLPFALLFFRRKLTKIVVTAGIVGSLLFTQSITAIILVPICTVLVLSTLSHRSFFGTRLALAGVAAVILMVLFWALPAGFVNDLISSKQGSILAHNQSLSVTPSPLDMLGFGTSTTFLESGLLALIIKGGILDLLMVITIGLVGVILGLRTLRRVPETSSSTQLAVIAGATSFLLAVVCGSINLSYITVFPINYLFFFFSSILISEYVFFKRRQDLTEISSNEALT